MAEVISGVGGGMAESVILGGVELALELEELDEVDEAEVEDEVALEDVKL